MSREINISKEFSDYLVNRNKNQGDGKFTAEDFRENFLQELEDDSWWKDPSKSIVLNFENVQTLGPSWANEVFAHYADLRFNINADDIQSKIKLKEISPVKLEIIKQEIESGFEKKVG